MSTTTKSDTSDQQELLAKIGVLFAKDDGKGMIEFLEERGWHRDRFSGLVSHPLRGNRPRTQMHTLVAALATEGRFVLRSPRFDEKPEQLS